MVKLKWQTVEDMSSIYGSRNSPDVDGIEIEGGHIYADHSIDHPFRSWAFEVATSA
jgi:hypothetical protein